MMENKQSTTGLADYDQREKEKKKPLNDGYEYAPATATLVEMTGSYYENIQIETVLLKKGMPM